MSKIPRIPTFTLKGIDEKIQDLQSVLSDNLTWLEYSFGKCEVHQKDVQGEIVSYPGVFVDNKTDPIDMRANDDYVAYSFWDVTDPGEMDYSEDTSGSLVKYGVRLYNISAIFWGNVDRIDSGNRNETKSNMRQDIIEVFENDLLSSGVIFTITQIYDRFASQVFAPYDLENIEDVIKWPYVGFRVNGILRFNRTCPVNNTYDLV